VNRAACVAAVCFLVLSRSGAGPDEPAAGTGADPIREAVSLFVNARTAGGLDAFVVAVERLREQAESGQLFFRFLLAVYAAHEPLCKLADKARQRYLEEGRPLMSRHAEAGNALAQYLVGVDCELNLAQPEDARRWYERAAAQGQALAQNRLGLMYYQGQGVAPDDVRAAAYFRQAALQADMNGEYNLGTLYAAGRGLPKDGELAFRLFQRAAGKGHAHAMNNLG